LCSLIGAQSRNRTGTPLRARDFKSLGKPIYSKTFKTFIDLLPHSCHNGSINHSFGSDMATIRKRGEFQWEAQIRRKGYPAVSMTFEIKVDAEDWARDLERDMRRGVFIDRRESETTTLQQI